MDTKNTRKKEFELQEIKLEPPKESLEDIRRERKRLEEEIKKLKTVRKPSQQ